MKMFVFLMFALCSACGGYTSSSLEAETQDCAIKVTNGHGIIYVTEVLVVPVAKGAVVCFEEIEE